MKRLLAGFVSIAVSVSVLAQPGMPPKTFLSAWTQGNDAGDFNNDGTINQADLHAYIWSLHGSWDDDTDPPIDPPIDPPSDNDFDWWPDENAMRFNETTQDGVEQAMAQLHGNSGFLSLDSQDAVKGFAVLVEHAGLSGTPSARVVVTTGPGVVFDQQIVNIKGGLADVAFDSISFVPSSHKNTVAVKIAGDCDRITFLNSDFANWRQVIEGQDAGTNNDGTMNEPDEIQFIGGSWSRIFNNSHPVVTAENQNQKGDRSQGAWWQGDGWQFIDVEMVGVGWDIIGDPNRKRTDKFTQTLYGSQNAVNTLVEGCVFNGTSNNAIVYKGTGLTVKDSSFNNIVNAISFGTNEGPRFPCAAVVSNVTIHDLIPLNWKDDPSLPDDERVRANSGVVFSFSNFEQVMIEDVKFVGTNTGTRNDFLFFSNGKSSNVMSYALVVRDCDTGSLDLAEVRNYRKPDTGLLVHVNNTQTQDATVLVRNTEPSSKSEIMQDFIIDGSPASYN